VSIAPVRESIRILAAEDLIEIRPRRSPIIAKVDENGLFEINIIRSSLETVVLKDAVPKHTDKSIKACEDILREDESCTDLWEKADLNMRFHMALLAPSSLHRVKEIIKNQYVGMARIMHYRLVNYLHQNPKLAWAHAAEHQSLMAAVREREIEKSVDLLEQHIARATERAKRLFSEPAALTHPSIAEK
ncbi:MAG: GntR family transcriptional regulator, partial [Rhizobium pusense]|nr:GntR family transcriptional regulator [Agrobacterium pusense]